MNSYRLHAEKYFDGAQFHHNKVLTICNGKISAIDDNVEQVDEKVSGLLTAGFIDLQVNGGGGALFNTVPTVQGIKQIINAHMAFGTTAMLPTFITDKTEIMAQAAQAMSEAINQQVPGILGIHFEGPHLSLAKKGAHSAEYIRQMSEQEWRILSRDDIGQVLVTLAPENVAASDVEKLVKQSIKVCIGHTNADFSIAQAAVNSGADGFTHLYNAMSPLQGREPGVVGCALLNDHCYAGIIVDGHHVAYDSLKLALKIKSNTQGKLILVTDAMSPVGTDETEFDFFDRKVYLQNGKLTSTTGELAGSVLDMATAVRNCVTYLELELAEALRMASLYPAQYIQQENIRGRLCVNYYADMVLLNDKLQVQTTWINGNKVYQN
jgi:N-acetylglucosamine-6-phosphate deacetylase